MDRTTDGAVPDALRGARSRAEAERLARRAFHRAGRRRRIVTAAGIDAADLSDHGRRILDWLADWDEPTVDGVVELVAATRAAAKTVEHRGDVDAPPFARPGSDAVAGDEPSGGRP
jgi:hypothetical protein